MFKILVVDDELTSTQLIKRILEMVGYEVSEASNGREALNIIREIQPDLIITDIMMPEMNGYQLIKLMRQNPEYANIQIIAMSAHYDENLLQMGANYLLLKPPTPFQLLKVAKELLDGKIQRPTRNRGTGIEEANSPETSLMKNIKSNSSHQVKDHNAIQNGMRLCKTARDLENDTQTLTPAQEQFWSEIRHRMKGIASDDISAQQDLYQQVAKLDDLAVVLAPNNINVEEQNTQLIQLLKSTRSLTIKERTIKCIGLNKNKYAFQEVTKYTSHRKPSVRLAVAFALGQFDFPRVIFALLYLITDSDSAVQIEATRALTKINTDSAWLIIEERLEQSADNPTQTINIINGFDMTDDDRAVTLLIKVLERYEHIAVICAVLDLLSSFSNARISNILEPFASHSHPQVREFAVKGLDKLS